MTKLVGANHTCIRYRIIPDRTGPYRTKTQFFGQNTGPDKFKSGPVQIPDRITGKIPDPVSIFYRHGISKKFVRYRKSHFTVPIF